MDDRWVILLPFIKYNIIENNAIQFDFYSLFKWRGERSDPPMEGIHEGGGGGGRSAPPKERISLKNNEFLYNVGLVRPQNIEWIIVFKCMCILHVMKRNKRKR